MRPSTVLIVDDTPQNINLIYEVLKVTYSVKAATSGQEAINICQSMPIDIILLDVMMPDMDGYETCRRIKNNPLIRSIPIIFVTAKCEIEDESLGFACGAVDYITKPIRPAIVKLRVKTQLAVHDQQCALWDMVKERTEELNTVYLEVIRRLGTAGEYRDNETGLHVVRVCHYASIISKALGFSESEAEIIYNASALHDIGKIGIADGILLKPGKLDEYEFKIIRLHCDIGCKIIGTHQNDLLKAAETIALTHHERWDGTGYPQGLKGVDIPLIGRIVAVADVFDALTSERPYKKAWPAAEAVEEIVRCREQHFDPQVVDVMLSVLPEMVTIQQQFLDK